MDPALGDGVVGGYRAGQWGLALDVRGWEVVSSVAEPVWFGGVKLVTSPNAVPEGEGERGKRLLEFLKKWVRFQNLQIRAEKERERQERHLVGDSGGNEERVVNGSSGSARGGLPTPAQRRRALVVSSSQVQNSQPRRTQTDVEKGKAREVTQSTQSQSQEGESFVTPSAATTRQEEMWTDFDLDADIDVDDVEVPDLWGGADTTTADAGDVEVEAPTLTEKPTTEEQPQQEVVSIPTQTQAHTQTQTQSQPQDLDPDESGLSDYERNARLRQRASKLIHHPPSASPPSPTPSSSSIDHTGIRLECLSPSCSPTSSQEGMARWHPYKNYELVKIPPSHRTKSYYQCDIVDGLPEAEVHELTCMMACRSKGTEDVRELTNEDVEVEAERLRQKYRLRKAWRDDVKFRRPELRDEWEEERQEREKKRKAKAAQVESKADTLGMQRKTETSNSMAPPASTQPLTDVASDVSNATTIGAITSAVGGVKSSVARDVAKKANIQPEAATSAKKAIKRRSPASSSPASSSSVSKKLKNKKHQEAIAAL